VSPAHGTSATTRFLRGAAGGRAANGDGTADEPPLTKEQLLAALQEALAREAAALAREAAERLARLSAENQKEQLLEELRKQNAANLAKKWAVAASRATLFSSAEQELLVVSEAHVLQDIPSLTAERRLELAAALHTLACPRDGAPERDAATPGSAHHILQTVLNRVRHELGPSCQLRVFYETEPDNNNRPDFTCVERHEAQLTWLSMLVAVEVKPRPVSASTQATLMLQGKVQALRYCACRVLALKEACPTAAPWQAMAVVTNGEVLCLIRMVYSGTSVVAYTTADEALLPLDAARQPAELTRGSELLARVLAASPRQLGSAFAAPPRTAEVLLPLGAPRQRQRPHLLTIDGAALGHGGFCDVFGGTLEGVEGAVAVKLARSAADGATALQLRREARVLRKLERAASPHVPRLLAHLRQSNGALGLVIAPVGVVATRARGADVDPGSPARRALAVACGEGVLSALRVAHAAGHLHADVRPTNILWRPPPHGAVLSDWGLTRAAAPSLKGLQSRALGWLECAPDAALRAELLPGAAWLPCAGTDCESALYALAAVAFGQPCGAAPWAAAPAEASDLAELLAARDAWFARLPPAHPLRTARATVHAWQRDACERDALLLPYALPHEWAAAL
jgi:hypothetical protein